MRDTAEYEKMCVYCEHATILHDNSYVLCTKKGVVLSTYSCRKFIYDPMKRTTRRKPVLSSIDDMIDLDQVD